jgi:cytochrome c
MDSMEINKATAGVLVAGIMFFLCGLLGTQLVAVHRPEKLAIPVEGLAAVTAEISAPKQESLPPIGPLLAKADVAAGEAMVKKLCASCHTVAEGGKAGVGPNLYNVVGAAHGHMDGFSYSAGMRAKPGPWSFDELNVWLHKPVEFVPGTRMAFTGISNDQQRADVIAYLRGLSANPLPLPVP